MATDSSPLGSIGFELASEALDMLCDLHSLYRHPSRRKNHGSEADFGADKLHGAMRLSNGITIGLVQVNRLLSLVCLVTSEGHQPQDRLESVTTSIGDACSAIQHLL